MRNFVSRAVPSDGVDDRYPPLGLEFDVSTISVKVCNLGLPDGYDVNLKVYTIPPRRTPAPMLKGNTI